MGFGRAWLAPCTGTSDTDGPVDIQRLDSTSHTHTRILALTATPDKGKFVTNQCWIVSCRKLYTLSWTGRVGLYILESELFGPVFLYFGGFVFEFLEGLS